MSHEQDDQVSAADAHTRELAERADDPTAWFERLYAQASRGAAQVPWDRGIPSALLIEWAEREQVDGTGHSPRSSSAPATAATPSSWPGWVSPPPPSTSRPPRSGTPEHASPTRRWTTSRPTCSTLPAAWLGGFDLVVEDMTVQSLPESLRPDATAAVASLVAPGGTLVVVAAARDEGQPVEGPPWPLTPSQARPLPPAGSTSVSLARIPDAVDPEVHRWLGLFTRHTPSVTAGEADGG